MKKKVNQEQLTVILPENFSADAILRPLGMRKDLHANLKAGMYFILDNILKMSQSRRWRDYFDEHGGYPLQSSILNQIVGKKYTTVVELMVENGIIRRTKGYQAGHQSKLFTLTKQYASVHHKIRSIPKEASLYKRLLQYREEQKMLNDAALAKIKYITMWFDPQRLTIDTKAAHALIEYYMVDMQSMIPDPLPKGRTLEEVEARLTHRVNSMIDTFRAVQNGYMGLKKTGQDNRLHSVVSSTKKELRSLYRYDGKPMSSIDIKASQPYLLTLLLNPISWGEKGVVAKVYPELFSRVSKPRYKKHLESILMFGAFSKTQSGKGFQNTGFHRFQWSTDFYQHLVGLAKAEGAEKVFPDRTSVKKKMMMILFDDSSYMDSDPGFKLFAKWFPEESGIISLLKQVSRDAKVNSPDGEGLSFLPVLLQRLESYLVLEKVCKQIAKELPDAPIIPVHDCIMTSDQHKDDVAIILERVLEHETGNLPGITKEDGSSSVKKKNMGQLVAEDLHEIMQKRPKGKHVSSGIKPPILFEPPDLEGDWLVYSRYDSSGDRPMDEKIIHIIDDTKKSQD